jgi:hypothetical protein
VSYGPESVSEVTGKTDGLGKRLTLAGDRRRFEAPKEPVMPVERWIDLKCHPSTRPETVLAIRVLVRRSRGELQLTFRLDGDISRVDVSSRNTSGLARELWRHTCFETFISVEGRQEYHEFNFAPSGESTVYAFRGYRNGSPVADEMMRPQIAVRSTDSRLELDARVRLDSLSALHSGASLRIGLAAVIEANDGFSYWALRHQAGQPDFHDVTGFALMLEPPGSE